jgi:hypothetical protein
LLPLHLVVAVGVLRQLLLLQAQVKKPLAPLQTAAAERCCPSPVFCCCYCCCLDLSA